MWMFTRYGFFDAVCARTKNGEPQTREDYYDCRGAVVDPDRVMIRARALAHLEALQARFPALLGGCEVQKWPEADYQFRIFASKGAWVEVLAGMAKEMDYDRFKSEVTPRNRCAALLPPEGKAGATYQRALYEVWNTVLKLREEA